MGWHGPDLCGRGRGHVVSPSEHGNEPSGSTKFEEFLDQIRNSISFLSKTELQGVNYVGV
jgi:hypothetical protein